MPKKSKPTHVSEPTGWKHVRSTYAMLTTKLETITDKETRKSVIGYWQDRLAEDLAEIENDGEPCYDPGLP